MKRYNGGIGQRQCAWLNEQLRKAEVEGVQVIAASHHAFPRGASADTHRAWNGDEVADVLTDSPAFVLGLAGHDHPGGFCHYRGRPFVTVEAMLEAPPGSNAFAVVTVKPAVTLVPGLRFRGGEISIDGCGTIVTNRRFDV